MAQCWSGDNQLDRFWIERLRADITPLLDFVVTLVWDFSFNGYYFGPVIWTRSFFQIFGGGE